RKERRRKSECIGGPKAVEKTGERRPWKSQERFPLSHSFNNNKLDDRDHFQQNAKTSVASLRGLIGSSRNTDRHHSGMLIDFIGIPTLQFLVDREDRIFSYFLRCQSLFISRGVDDVEEHPSLSGAREGEVCMKYKDHHMRHPRGHLGDRASAQGARGCAWRDDQFGRGQNPVLGWSDPTFAHGSVAKV